MYRHGLCCGKSASTHRRRCSPLMVRRRTCAVSNHEATVQLILRDAAKTPLLERQRRSRLRGDEGTRRLAETRVFDARSKSRFNFQTAKTISDASPRPRGARRPSCKCILRLTKQKAWGMPGAGAPEASRAK